MGWSVIKIVASTRHVHVLKRVHTYTQHTHTFLNGIVGLWNWISRCLATSLLLPETILFWKAQASLLTLYGHPAVTGEAILDCSISAEPLVNCSQETRTAKLSPVQILNSQNCEFGIACYQAVTD